MRKITTLLLFAFFCFSVAAQKEWSNWYYDGKNMLTFKNGYAEIVHNFINPVPPDSNLFNYYNWGRGGISYSNPATGKMEFIISNRVGFNRDYNDFPNDNFIRSCPDDYSYHIIPFHDNSNRYYVIQFQDYSADLLQQQDGLQVRCPNAIGLGYSIADLNMNNGLGDFSTVNNIITAPLTAQMTTVRHANGKDVWIIVHPYNSSQFSAILVTDNGIQPAVNSAAGPYVGGGFSSVGGTLTATHDGKLLAGYSEADKTLQLFNFDNGTGRINSYKILPYKESVGKLQFSPDNSKLYYICSNGLYQYDLNEGDVASTLTKVYNHPYAYTYDMQLAPDGKIYVTKTITLVNNEYTEYTGAVECPNLPQYACNFNPTALNTLQVSFPDLINDFIKDPKAPLTTKLNIGKDSAVCFGSYTITAPDGWESYRWNSGETTKAITVTKPGLYYVLTGNTGFSCPSGYGYIIISDKAVKLNLGKDTSLCQGSPYRLHINDNYTNITWQNGSHTRDSVITKNNAYVISANDRNGCFTNDTIGIYFKNEPSAKFGPDTAICNNAPLVLSLYPQSNPFYSGVYKWQDGSTNDKFTVTGSGTYRGTVSYSGCTVSDTIQVNYVNADNVYLGRDTALCLGDSLLLQSNIDNAAYLWSTGVTTRSIYAKTSDRYTVKVSTSVCALTDTINVVFNNRPSFSLGSDTAICDKGTLLLEPGTTTGSYLWQDHSANKNFTVNSPGLYWLQLTQDGCIAADSINVAYKPLPEVNLGDDTGFCKGQSLVLNAFKPGITSYFWQDQSTQPSYVAKEKGIYSVRIVGNNGCVNSDSITISVQDPPSFSLGSDTILCATKTLNYHFNLPGATYLWNDGSAQNNYAVNIAGNYSLTVSQSGCSSSDTVNIGYKPMPKVNLGNDTVLCNNNTFLLNAKNAGATYAWQDNSTQSFLTVMKAGRYYVQVDLNGCTKADTILMIHKNKPSFSLGADAVLCQGQQLLLEPLVGDGVSYLWQNGSTQPHFAVIDSGLYRLQVTNECGSAADEIKITSSVCMVQLPNAFTPNKDGLNDIFRIKYPFPVTRFSMIVYNRLGQKIFESNDINKGWDGSYKGNQQSMDTYVWMISLMDAQGKGQQARGTVVLVR